MRKKSFHLRQLVVVCLINLTWIGTWLGRTSLAQQTDRSGTGKAISSESATCEPGYQLVERTIQVPMMVTERRVIEVTECRSEVRERTVMVPKMIPETRQVRDVYTVMVPHTEVKTEHYQVCRPVWHDVVRDVTVQVPAQELRKETRRVCRPVEVQEMREVTQDHGNWEEVFVEITAYGGAWACRNGDRWLHACGGCGTCRSCRSICQDCDAGCAPAVIQQTQRVWKPNLVAEQVPVMVCRQEIVEEPYEYYVTTYHPETRTQTVRVCEQVRQEKQREVEVTVCVPQKREALRNISTFRTVNEPHVQRYCVQVPHKVQKEIEVQVCRMVTKTIVCKVPVACPNN